ncbi:MAG: hypothetical protein ACFFCQ_12550, partial [Promethearchaeota archaeon]
GASSAIAALICGIIIRNPKYLGLKLQFSRIHLYNFWEDITFLFELIAFILIGLLLIIEDLPEYILLATIISILVIVIRILVIFLTTLPFELKKETATIFSNKERFFIGIAGFKGLTTGILASYAFVNLEEINHQLAVLILYSSILLILITGTFQGLILRPISQKLDVVEELLESDEIKARIVGLQSELDKLISDRSNKQITASNFIKLSYPLKDELYLLEERLTTISAQEAAKRIFIEYQLQLSETALEALAQAHDGGEITAFAYSKLKNEYTHHLEELKIRLNSIEEPSKIDTSQYIATAEEIDIILLQEAVDTLSKKSKMKRVPELLQAQKLLNKIVKKRKKKATEKKGLKRSNTYTTDLSIEGDSIDSE